MAWDVKHFRPSRACSRQALLILIFILVPCERQSNIGYQSCSARFLPKWISRVAQRCRTTRAAVVRSLPANPVLTFRCHLSASRVMRARASFPLLVISRLAILRGLDWVCILPISPGLADPRCAARSVAHNRVCALPVQRSKYRLKLHSEPATSPVSGPLGWRCGCQVVETRQLDGIRRPRRVASISLFCCFC